MNIFKDQFYIAFEQGWLVRTRKKPRNPWKNNKLDPTLLNSREQRFTKLVFYDRMLFLVRSYRVLLLDSCYLWYIWITELNIGDRAKLFTGDIKLFIQFEATRSERLVSWFKSKLNRNWKNTRYKFEWVAKEYST